MVKQNGKYYWDLLGVHTRLPAKMDSIKLLVSKDILSLDQAKVLPQKVLAEEIRNKINNSFRYMEVPTWITIGRI